MNLTDEDVCALAAALRSDILVRSLEISHNMIGDNGALALAEMLGHNTTLTAINLSHNRIRRAGGEALSRAVRSRQHRTTILCGCNHSSMEGMEEQLRGTGFNSHREPHRNALETSAYSNEHIRLEMKSTAYSKRRTAASERPERSSSDKSSAVEGQG